jgi:hypothetical protein
MKLSDYDLTDKIAAIGLARKLETILAKITALEQRLEELEEPWDKVEGTVNLGRFFALNSRGGGRKCVR